jgi:hypothetical protein
LKGADRAGDVSQPSIDFRQSYVVGRFDHVAKEDDIAEYSVISQIDKVEAIKVQLEKFKKDLGTLPQQNPVVTKTLENMDYLERDVGRLAQQLRIIRAKIHDETSSLRERERQLADRVESMKYEMSINLSQLEEMDSKRAELEVIIKNLKESRNEAQSQSNDTALRNLQGEITELNSKIEILERQVIALNREIERKDQMIYEKNSNIASLNEELNDLLENADTSTKKQVMDRLSVSLIDRDSDDEGLNPNDLNLTPSQINTVKKTPESLKKKYLIKFNDSLRREVDDLKNSLEKAIHFSDQLKSEIRVLKEQASGDYNAIDRHSLGFGGDFGLDPNILNMRSTDMFNVFKQEINRINEEVNKEPTEEKIRSIRASLANLKELGESNRLSIGQSESNRLSIGQRESFNPYLEVDVKDENRTSYGRLSDPFTQLQNDLPVKPETQPGLSETDIINAREEVQREADQRIKEMQQQFDNIKSQSNGKEITIGQLRTKLDSAIREATLNEEEKKILLQKIEDLENNKESHTPVENTEADKQYTIEANLSVQYKKEISLLTNKIEQLKMEMEYYRRHAQQSDPNIQFDGLAPAPEHQAHPGHSAKHHHGHSHYYPTPGKPTLEELQKLEHSAEPNVTLPHQSMMKIEELTPTLRNSEPLELLSPVIQTYKDLKQSTLMQSKIQKIETGLNNLAASRLESRPKPQRDERTAALNRLNKEYSLTQGNIVNIKRKLEDNQAQLENVKRDLDHADKIKAEEKIIVELESREATVQSQKSILLCEYDICAQIEKDLKEKISALVAEIESSGRDEQSSALLKSAIMQSRIVLEERDNTPVSNLKAAKELEDLKDPQLLAIPEEFETIKNAEDQFQTDTIPLAAPLNFAKKSQTMQEKPTTAEDEEKQRQKDIMNEKLSSRNTN